MGRCALLLQAMLCPIAMSETASGNVVDLRAQPVLRAAHVLHHAMMQ